MPGPPPCSHIPCHGVNFLNCRILQLLNFRHLGRAAKAAAGGLEQRARSLDAAAALEHGGGGEVQLLWIRVRRRSAEGRQRRLLGRAAVRVLQIEQRRPHVELLALLPVAQGLLGPRGNTDLWGRLRSQAMVGRTARPGGRGGLAQGGAEAVKTNVLLAVDIRLWDAGCAETAVLAVRRLRRGSVREGRRVPGFRSGTGS